MVATVRRLPARADQDRWVSQQAAVGPDLARGFRGEDQRRARLKRFYENHQAQRDQFEILGICVDHGEKKSVAEVDKSPEPIVEHVWGEKPLLFPVLLDPSMKMLDTFGVPGYETLQIDPEGRLVEGDETTLAKRIKGVPLAVRGLIKVSQLCACCHD